MTVVVVSSRSFGSGCADPEARLREAGVEVRRIPSDHDLARCGPQLADADGWIAGTGPIRGEHLRAAPRLRLVARYGVGVDSVDRAEAAARGVLVTNTPGANTRAVAEHTLALLLGALRHVVAGDRAVRAGDWAPRRGRELADCRVGIVGYGAIGRAVGRLVAAFGAEVAAHDPWVTDADVDLVDLDTLAASCDVLSLHAPAGDRPLVDTALLGRMRPGAVLVNTARGGLVDEAAVATALRDGRLAGFAADVLADEHGASSPLFDAPNVTVTPHVAGQTVQAIDRMGAAAADECLRVLVEGRPPRHPVPPPRAEE
ncbi:NAD(P)-dependent oxidoreductase [Egicoccus sp. AB-alg2]|uniref:NAD(P)-dependent oxidoreductase n=1 Tax=Egicoccus sp. AB-alg2 TaxID=3242693 RepID=UPI00359EC230